MVPSITWVNHAGFIYDDGHVRLICDPWLEGRTFYNGWDLLAKSAMAFSDFDAITHIWISHEHPDHLSPPNLQKIEPRVRERITVLYQRTPVRRVAKFLASLGFKEVVELDPAWLRISPKTDLYCGPCRTTTSDDSYLALRSEAGTILNLNDCVVTRPENILDRVGRPDVMLAQFSFACWTGNRDEPERRQAAADLARELFLRNVTAFKPRFVIPSASFSWFCNSENYWMNEKAHRIDQIVVDTAATGATPIVLYPGDVWELGAERDNSSAVERYQRDYQRTESAAELFQNPIVDIERLRDRARSFGEKLRAANSTLLVAMLRPARIYLDDHQLAVELSPRGLRLTACPRERCDVALGSDSLDYALRYLWGGDTLNINGRFEKPRMGQFSRFRIYFAIASLNNSGTAFDFRYILGNAKTVAIKALDYSRTNRSQKAAI